MYDLETIVKMNNPITEVKKNTHSKKPKMPKELLNAIIDYEMGELNQEAIIGLFQALLDSGVIWQLQGNYGRTARSLINAGLISVK